MISLELIEEKVPEFTYDELIHLPEKFVNSLKMHSSVQEINLKRFNPGDFFWIWKNADLDPIDEDLRKLKSEWDRNSF